MKKKHWFIIAGVVALGAIMIASDETQTPRQKEIAAQFSPVNGECYKLTERIKQEMNDPNSYENIETKYWDVDTALLVNQSYTGKNQFGGRVRGFVKAIISNNGNVEIIESR